MISPFCLRSFFIQDSSLSWESKIRRLVQYSPVSRTYLNHVTFLLILPVFSEFCVLYVQCGFQSTFGTLYKLRKALARRTRPLLYLREKETAIWEWYLGLSHSAVIVACRLVAWCSLVTLCLLIKAGSIGPSFGRNNHPFVFCWLSVLQLSFFVYSLGSRTLKCRKEARPWWCWPLIPKLGRQRQADLCEFKDSRV